MRRGMMDLDENEEMGYAEKSKLPYVLLLDPQTDRAAAYTNNHRLITPLASAELVSFAKENVGLQRPWDEAKYDPTNPEWRALPEWATPDVRARCVLLWINRGLRSAAFWRSIPQQ